jgi:S1-C subfamily serine protease
MSDFGSPEFDLVTRPKPDDVSFDLNTALNAVVSLTSRTPENAFTAQTLGTERAGNGVLIRDDGLILTIGYLITEAESVWIVDNNGKACAAHVVGYDQETGLGLVQAMGRLDIKPLKIGNSATLSEDEPVIFAGSGGCENAMCAEIVSTREFAGYWEYVLDQAIFITPAHHNWGGGAMIAMDGTLRGIGSLFVQQAHDGETPLNGNMVVPIDLLAPIMDDLLMYGKINKPTRPWLGILTTEVNDHLMIGGLAHGGPAEKAGLETGDLILEIDGRPVNELVEMYRFIWASGNAGVDVPMEILRDGESIHIQVRSASRSDFFVSPKMH